MDIVIGNYVTGDNLFGRENELKGLWYSIQNNSIVLISPRRFGKTSLLQEMKSNPLDDWNVIYMDIEHGREPEDYIINLIHEAPIGLWNKIKNFMFDAKDGIEELNGPEIGLKLKTTLQKDWKEKGTRIMKQLYDENKKTILIIDELPKFLLNLEEKLKDNGKTIKEFLEWLRTLRHNYGLRMIICGSISIENILMKYDLKNETNDLERIIVKPFSEEKSIEMAEILLEKYPHDTDVLHDAIRKNGIFIPFFIQLFVKEIVDQTNYGERKATVAEIELAAKNAIFGTRGNDYYTWYKGILKNELDIKDYNIALEILNLLSKNESATKQELQNIYHGRKGITEGFEKLLMILQNGFYIKQENDEKYQMHNKIFQLLWRMNIK